jgi:L-fucose mutarotase/ribose pyranase (RbsD/FucU family)
MNPKAAKSKIIFNELYISWDDDIVLTEGVFDAIVAGKNSIPILGSSLKETSKLFKSIIMNDTPVYVALDKDASKKASILIDSLVKYGIEVYRVDISPYNDVGEMTRSEFLTRKQNAKQLSSEEAFYEKILNGFKI